MSASLRWFSAHHVIFLFRHVASSRSYIFAILATSHEIGNNSVIVRNSLIIGAITPNDCSDTPDPTTISAINSPTAVPRVSATSSSGNPGGRTGISFPYFSRDNMIPRHPYTSIGAYPCRKFLRRKVGSTCMICIPSRWSDDCYQCDICLLQRCMFTSGYRYSSLTEQRRWSTSGDNRSDLRVQCGSSKLSFQRSTESRPCQSKRLRW